MLLFRSLSLGLLGACCLLLAQRPQTAVVLANPPPQIVVMPASSECALEGEPTIAAPPVTVIDVAPGVSGALVAKMIVLAANERIIAINDAPVHNADLAFANVQVQGHQYLDVAIVNNAGITRRVLVLAP